MKKRISLLTIFLAVIGLAFLGLVLTIIFSFYGDPISAAIATGKIRTYVAQQYPQENFQVNEAKYNFKFRTYGVRIQSDKSIDTHFYVSVDRHGKIEDSYSSDVEEKYNTLFRLDEELDEAIETLLHEGYPHETRIAFATMKGDFTPGVLEKSLTLDMPFDLHRLPLPVELSVFTSAEQPDYETLAQRLLQLKALMDQNDVKIDFYSLYLEYPYHKKDGDLLPEKWDSVSLSNFPAEQIVDSPDLPQILAEYQQAYELESNKEKQAEIDSALEK